MAAPVVIGESTSLSVLASRINAEHREAETAARTAIEHARNVGELLLEAKERLQHGQWLHWLAQNCDVKERQARNYMHLAENWTTIQAKSAPGADLTVKGALRLLQEPKQDSHERQQVSKCRLLSDESVYQRRALCETWWNLQATYVLFFKAVGWPTDRIADFLGISESADVAPIIKPNPPARAREEFVEVFPGLDQASYRDAVWCRIHCWLERANSSAASSADDQSLLDVKADLEETARHHWREYERLTQFAYVKLEDEYTFNVANVCVDHDARLAVGIDRDQPGETAWAERRASLWPLACWVETELARTELEPATTGA